MAEGIIKYYGLDQWWYNALSADDRQYIAGRIVSLGGKSESLTSDTIEEIVGETATAANFLAAMLGWFSRSERDLRIRGIIREKVRELIAALPAGLARHFSLQALISDSYRQRDSDAEAIKDTLWACREQIAIEEAVRRVFRSRGFVPTHVGFERMAIVLEKEGRLQEAVDVAKQARDAGWAGTWHKRITRLESKLAKLKSRGKSS